MAPETHFLLNTGAKIPAVGLGKFSLVHRKVEGSSVDDD